MLRRCVLRDCRGRGPLLHKQKNAARRPRFSFNQSHRDYCAPIFTSVTSNTSVAFGGKPFFGSAP